MFADVPPLLTYCADWYMLGWPASVVVPCALSASLITLFLVVARRARPLWRFVTLVFCVSLFIVADYVAYEIGNHNQHLWRKDNRRPPRPDDLDRRETPFVKPTE